MGIHVSCGNSHGHGKPTCRGMAGCVQDTTRLTYLCLDSPGKCPCARSPHPEPPEQGPPSHRGVPRCCRWCVVCLLVLFGLSSAALRRRCVSDSVALYITEGDGKGRSWREHEGGKGREALSGVLNFLIELGEAPGEAALDVWSFWARRCHREERA